jgi:hypothetical protein
MSGDTAREPGEERVEVRYDEKRSPRRRPTSSWIFASTRRASTNIRRRAGLPVGFWISQIAPGDGIDVAVIAYSRLFPAVHGALEPAVFPV